MLRYTMIPSVSDKTEFATESFDEVSKAFMPEVGVNN